MKVTYLSPTYFADASCIGGGERYAVELATAMADLADTTLVSFSDRRERYRLGALKVEIYPVSHLLRDNKLNPLSFQYLRSVLAADVVHLHHIYTFVCDLSCLVGSTFGKRVYVTDHGGGADLVLNQKLPVFQGYRSAVAQSRFALDFLPKPLQKKSLLIKGGIDTRRFCPEDSVPKEKQILYVGRILPHKGINYLIEAFRLLARHDYRLVMIGRVYSERFFEYLQELATGLPVTFLHDADDQRILKHYRQARVSVLPSVHTDCYGGYTPVPELMGLTLLEAQACGTPVICTDAGGMHEFVEPGQTGSVVEQNSPTALAAALRHYIELSDRQYAQYQQNCRAWVEPLSWQAVARQHLEAYGAEDLVTRSASAAVRPRSLR